MLRCIIEGKSASEEVSYIVKEIIFKWMRILMCKSLMLTNVLLVFSNLTFKFAINLNWQSIDILIFCNL